MQQDNIDAFTGGVRPDGLKNKSEIKVLVCFLLSHSTQPLSRKEMTDIFLDRGLANYFEASDAISSLIKHENVIENAEDGALVITESGKIIADTLYDALPMTIRETKSYSHSPKATAVCSGACSGSPSSMPRSTVMSSYFSFSSAACALERAILASLHSSMSQWSVMAMYSMPSSLARSATRSAGVSLSKELSVCR